MRKKFFASTVMLAVLLTGCTTTVPKLSKLDNNMAAQYVANALLKSDKEYEWTVDYDHALLTATPTPQPTKEPELSPTPEVSNVSATDDTGADEVQTDSFEEVSLSELYGDKGIKVDAVSYQVTKSYGTDYAVCTHTKGKKLLVVQFRISNTTAKKQRVNFAKKQMSSSLAVNGKEIGSPLLSLVDGDLQYFNEVLKPKQKKQGVLLFEVDKSAKISDVEIQFVKGNKTASVKVH